MAIKKRPASQATSAICKRPSARQLRVVRKRPSKAPSSLRTSGGYFINRSGYTGSQDSDGLQHGTGTCIGIGWTYEGQFFHGACQGEGKMQFSDGSICMGHFHANMPHGRCEYFDPEDNTTLIGTYVRGELHGPAVQVDEAGHLIFRGSFAHDLRIGVAEVFDEYGGRIVGPVDDEGDHTGDDILYVFPDNRTALVGIFKDGQFCSGYYAEVLGELKPRDDRSILEDSVALSAGGACLATVPQSERSSRVPDRICRDVSTRWVLCQQPLVADLYEMKRVEVKASTINVQMDGLFARVGISAGEYCSWYNGLRCTHDEVNSRSWDVAQATITLDSDTVLDIPAEYNSTSSFCACLGHKANHFLPNNAKYDVFEHPRFGLIKAIRAVRDIIPGEEICCDYGYEGAVADLPEWYKQSQDS